MRCTCGAARRERGAGTAGERARRCSWLTRGSARGWRVASARARDVGSGERPVREVCAPVLLRRARVERHELRRAGDHCAHLRRQRVAARVDGEVWMRQARAVLHVRQRRQLSASLRARRAGRSASLAPVADGHERPLEAKVKRTFVTASAQGSALSASCSVSARTSASARQGRRTCISAALGGAPSGARHYAARAQRARFSSAGGECSHKPRPARPLLLARSEWGGSVGAVTAPLCTHPARERGRACRAGAPVCSRACPRRRCRTRTWPPPTPSSFPTRRPASR